ncbi:diphthamide synthesis protein [Candidatus Pacearchaeota archaeon]|nr:diphthamide synthesis protein [Candidatus Pacearchaeota archaeon]
MESSYDMEVSKIIAEIKKAKAKTVLLQFPDGLKQFSGEVVDEIKEKTDCLPIIWFGNCFGACDIPIVMLNKVDLIVQIGHNRFIKNPRGWKI